MAKTSLGVEIAYNQMVMVYAKSAFKGTQLAAHGVHALNSTKSIREQLEPAAEAIKDFMRTHRIASANIFLSVPSRLAVSRKIDLPLAVKENLAQTVQYELEKYAPIPVDEIAYDYQIVEENAGANRISLLVFMAKKSELEGYFEFTKSIHAGVSGIEVSTSSLANWLSYCFPEIRKTNTAVLFTGTGADGDESELLIFRKRRLIYSRVLRGEKRHHGFTNILSRISGLLPSDSGGETEPIPVPVLVVGNDVEDILREQLETDVRFQLRMPSPAEAGLPSWGTATAYGLALRGLDLERTQINLLPVNLRKRPSKAGFLVMVFLTVCVILAGIAWSGSHLIKQRRAYQQIDTQIEQLAAEAEGIEGIRRDVEAAREKLDYLAGLKGHHFGPLDVLKELTRRIPQNAWVRDMTLSGDSVKLDGHAESASELITILDASPYFKDVVFLSAITKGRDGKERFRIGLNVKTQ